MTGKLLYFAVLLTFSAAGWADSLTVNNRFSQLSASQTGLVEIPNPDVTKVDAPVQKQIQDAESQLRSALAAHNVPDRNTAAFFGKLGQIYQAYGFDDAALACYTNAVTLSPNSFRWRYYLAYVYELKGEPDAGLRNYQEALKLAPGNGFVILRLGEVELELNHLDSAKSWLINPLVRQAAPAKTMEDLGKISLAQHQYQDAVNYFKQALASEQQASSIHYQLAMAYRGLGDLQQMQEQLSQRGDAEPTARDPLLAEINEIKQGRVSLLDRGDLALQERRFTDAVNIYRQLVELDRSDPIGYIYLATALSRAGRQTEAMKQYGRALELDPNSTTAHYDLGVLLTEAGQEAAAISHFRAAVRVDPQFANAHFQLANLLIRKGKDIDAGREYGIVASFEPQNGFARLMQAMAAVHAGAYPLARSLLDAAFLALPKDPDIANALTRILAAAPDAAVRDETRALAIIDQVVKGEPSFDLETGVTLGMALAGVGRYKDAAAGQRAMIGELEKNGRDDVARELKPNLARYEQGQPCRMPWTLHDPIFAPKPSKVLLWNQSKTMTANAP